MDEADNGPFFKLLNLEKKYVKYTNHLQYLNECEARSVISKGFQLKKPPNIRHVSENFEQEWDNIHNDCSHYLQRHLIGELSMVVSSLEERRRALVADFEEEWKEVYMESIHRILSRTDSAMKAKHDRKLRTLCGTETADATSDAAVLGPVLSSPQVSFQGEQEWQPYNIVGGTDLENTGNSVPNALGTRSVGATTSGLNSVNGCFRETAGVDTERGSEEATARRECLVLPNEEETFLAAPGTIQTVAETTAGLNTVVNLSQRELTDNEVSLLSKGLNFCPTPSDFDRYKLRRDIYEFIWRIRLKEYFYDGDNVGDFSNVPAFRNKSSWCPEWGRELAIEAYSQAVEEEILSSIKNEGRVYSNLKPAERLALRDLKTCDDIVIKEVDKGSGVVVMDKDIYIQEGFRQRGDQTVNRETGNDLTQQISEIVNERIRKLYSDGFISDKTLDYLLINTKPRAGRFYLLPKIHKKGCPGRRVILGCGTCTERISEFVDGHIKHLVPEIPSFIKDNKHFLQVLNGLGKLPEGAILVIADVVGLYPHIPHDEGLGALREALAKSPSTSVAADDLVDLARLVLKNNNLTFNGRHYLQIQGTAIGTKMAPSYANICDRAREIVP